jgi:hypothetical protein
MLGLPKSTEINKPFSKKAVFDKFKPSPGERKLFDEQVSRMAIVGEISPQTVSIAPRADVTAIYLIHVALKVPVCDKKNIALLSKLIDQRMVFVLQYENAIRLAAYRAQRTLISESKPADKWKLSLSGLDLEAVWENIIADVGDIDLPVGGNLDEAIAETERREKLTKQIAILGKKAMDERQPRRKWEYAEELKRLKAEQEEMNG